MIIGGHRTVALCARCDADDPSTSGVVAFFLVHESITADTVTDAAPVIREWIDHVVAHPPAYSDDDLDGEIALWRHDEGTSGLTDPDDAGGVGPDGPTLPDHRCSGDF